MREWSRTRIVCALVVLLMAVAPARADKIVLKNGRKILAYNVVEVGDKIQYETAAGTADDSEIDRGSHRKGWADADRGVAGCGRGKPEHCAS